MSFVPACGPVHAEAARIDVGDDHVALTGTLIGVATPRASGELVARRRADGFEARSPAELDGDRFRGDVPVARLPWTGPEEPEFWGLYGAVDGEELRVGRHLDDVSNKRRAYVFPLREL